jgi:hypothetical protein
MEIGEELTIIAFLALSPNGHVISHQLTWFRIAPLSCFNRSRNSPFTLDNAESSPDMNPTGK